MKLKDSVHGSAIMSLYRANIEDINRQIEYLEAEKNQLLDELISSEPTNVAIIEFLKHNKLQIQILKHMVDIACEEKNKIALAELDEKEMRKLMSALTAKLTEVFDLIKKAIDESEYDSEKEEEVEDDE